MLKSVADPFSCLETMGKYSHHFDVGQKVRVKADGRFGTIENFTARQTVNVKLDSGHLVQYSPDEIEPEDWNSGESFDGKKVRGLVAAIEAGAVSAFDLNLLKRASENRAVRRGLCDPLDFDESADHSILGMLVEKYGDTETLAKRAAAFVVGQEVLEKYTGRRGRVTRVAPFSLDIQFDEFTSATVLSSSVVAA